MHSPHEVLLGYTYSKSTPNFDDLGKDVDKCCSQPMAKHVPSLYSHLNFFSDEIKQIWFY